jgi:hypothetical protein
VRVGPYPEPGVFPAVRNVFRRWIWLSRLHLFCTDAERAAHVAALRIPTEYITCLTRFGRVFFGLGQLVLALGLLQIALLPAWLAIAAAVLGVGAMALTMGLPDELERYRPVFHLNAAWLLAVGLVLLGRAPPM